MKKNKRLHGTATALNSTPEPIQAMEQVYKEPTNLAFLLHWLAGTILFLLFYNIAIPYLLGSIHSYDPATGVTANNLFFGICGLFIYFIEPLVHYSFTNQQQIPDDDKPSKQPVDIVPESLAESINNYITDFFRLIGIALLGMPYMILVWFKPIFRIFILFESFSLLNLGGGESKWFVIIVMTDIFLYYSNLVFPNWKHSPTRVIARSALFNKPVVLVITRFFSIIFTAIICTGFAAGAYQQTGHPNDKAGELIVLLGFWYLLTLYVRMDYIGSHIDNLYETIKAMPRRNLLLNILILVISFLGFMWKYIERFI